MFAIDTLDGEHVGALNMNSIDERNGTFSIGIQVDKDERGQGYDTRAIKILLTYAFLERRLYKFNDYVLEGNEGSMRMMLKLGCVQEGIRRQDIYTNGRYQDLILFSLRKDEFLAHDKI